MILIGGHNMFGGQTVVGGSGNLDPIEVATLPAVGTAAYTAAPMIVRLTLDGKDYTKIAVDGWKELPDA